MVLSSSKCNQQKLHLLQDTFHLSKLFGSHAMEATFCLGSNSFSRKMKIVANYFITYLEPDCAFWFIDRLGVGISRTSFFLHCLTIVRRKFQDLYP